MNRKVNRRIFLQKTSLAIGAVAVATTFAEPLVGDDGDVKQAHAAERNLELSDRASTAKIEEWFLATAGGKATIQSLGLAKK